jgi:preprotein translocase subunit SecD
VENVAPAVLEIRLVLPEPTDQSVRAAFGGEILYLAPEPVVSDSDFITVQAIDQRDSSGRQNMILRVECLPEADERMRSISGRNVDGRMAVLFDGVVRSASIVNSAVGCSSGAVSLPAADGEAERIVERVRSRWPEG